MPPRRTPGSAAVDAYLEQVPSGLRSSLQRLRRAIRGAAPGADEVLSYRMPAFRQDGILVYYAAFTHHCSLFVASTAVRRRFSVELAPFAGGKGTVRFTPERPLPTGLVTRIVRARLVENAEREAARAGRRLRTRPEAGARRSGPGGPRRAPVRRTRTTRRVA